MSSLAIEVNQLTFSLKRVSQSESIPILEDISLTLERGSRCLLVGANGADQLMTSFNLLSCYNVLTAHAGKSTLLQILAGKRMTRSGAKVLDQDVFFKTPPGVTYLGTEWAANPVVRSDLAVSHFLDSVGGYRHKERRDELLRILDVDVTWHMHQISDGERRRVQIVSGLMVPWDVLLLDEVTVDLDVLVRTHLLQFLVRETKERKATILYATHIFDGLDSFPTALLHLSLGKSIGPSPLAWPLAQDEPSVPAQIRDRMRDPNRIGSQLLELVLYWLEEDKKERIAKGDARITHLDPKNVESDSEKFYRQYDYSH